MQLPSIGVLGGGQLGRMLLQAGLNLDVTFHMLDPDAQAPCHELTPHFTHGSLTDPDTVRQFGQAVDLVTIEIENVSTDALEHLQQAGKRVFPQPQVIRLIQDKRLQKQFYQQHGIPTADFILTENRADAAQYADFLPAFHKLGREGYDGRGVQRLTSAADLPKAFDAPGLLEKLVDFEKEIAVIVARNERGEVSTFPPVEMVFHPEHNLVEYLYAPARIDEAVAAEADRLAKKLITALDMVGLLAVEMFVDKSGQVLVNEVAPRPHNSGHHTIEANATSQYEQHLRAILNLPLGPTDTIRPAAMVNLLGEPGHTGPAHYEGLNDVLAMEGVHVHLYGKKLTKPFRKMGHVTIVDSDPERLWSKAEKVKNILKVITL
ncbi:5-(carboxyamino)imidazole ribonucleotide synthase [Catalinimonas alkaloidigena]|uniref:N5-carboxyaminoimidazole ribonucleotide synthase n=1 Tax=Catalinimonas alkaloidigena TaxID=1075417 RepID=A0A1G9MNZ9_9BACT|nr:5-(carboxyamino)imidazole ribonucleotide synthase [Catalinimonas alkaloidigena]SDL75385.1 5-(carboxyamino)imidazole ribonucleotide synthase [Catalinimonas alkaloidigena]